MPPNLPHAHTQLSTKSLLTSSQTMCSPYNWQERLPWGGERRGDRSPHPATTLKGPVTCRERRGRQRKRNKKDKTTEADLQGGKRKTKREIHVEKDWETQTKTG